MGAITISAYEIGIRPLGDKETRIELQDFDNGTDLFHFLRDYIGSWTENSEEELELIDNEVKKKVIRLSPGTLSPFGREVSGILESGGYGYEADIIDRTTGERVHEKGLDHAEMIPFYFQIIIPSQGQSGILLLQRFKQFGVYSVFKDAIKRKFSQEHNDHRLELTPLVSDEIIDDFVNNGRLNKITFKKLNLTPEIIQQGEKGSSFDENSGRIEYSIIASRGNNLPLLHKVRNSFRMGVTNYNNIFNVSDFEFDNIAVNVTLNGHTRTMDLSSLANVGAFFDISNEVIMDEDRGHPNLDSIREIVRGIQEDLFVSLYPVNIN